MAKAKAKEGSSVGMSPSEAGYGKRSVWQWIIIYIVLAVVIYGVIYYFVQGNRSQSTGTEASSQSLY